ncbi:MAG: patatin-like phospholipase family protein [Oscillospiraceae bacterium]|jgi:predicted acylesterase/phospholipase RssA|nr:patatin-like phospholipase family protein [Oscillospiraceae bacterium]
MKKALVFAGGGSKGAYEYGAWKALEEMGLEFDIVTGTSIGSINAALYVQHDFDAATVVWNEMDMDHVMVNGIQLDAKLKSIVEQRKGVIPFLKSYINSKGADIAPFIQTIETYQNSEKFFRSNVDFGLVTVRFPSMTPVEILKKDIKEDYLGRWVLASCSCFPIFPICEIDGQSYIDGGYYDNLPIATAFRLGADSVVAIDLNHEGAHPAYMRHPLVTYIKPSKDLGGFMRFDRAAMDWMIAIGYNDTMKAFGRLYGNQYSFLLPDMDRLHALAMDFVKDITYYEISGVFSLSSLLSRPLVNAPCTDIFTKGSLAETLTPERYFLLALEKTMELFDYPDSEIYSMRDVFSRLIKDSAEAIDPGAEERQASVDQLTKLIKSRSEKRQKGIRLFEHDYEQMIAVSLINCIIKHTV